MFMDHEMGRQCLLDVSAILDNLGIPFFLMQGTALGAWRDNGFVPTERDIDIGIMQEDLTPRAVRLVESLVVAGFEIETFMLPFRFIKTIVAYKYGCKADLVGLSKHGNHRFTSTPVRPSVPQAYCLVHDAYMVERWREHILFGRKFNLPQTIEEYLLREYGPEWQVPKDDHVSRTRVYNYLVDQGIV